jgi:hypothetical protein
MPRLPGIARLAAVACLVVYPVVADGATRHTGGGSEASSSDLAGTVPPAAGSSASDGYRLPQERASGECGRPLRLGLLRSSDAAVTGGHVDGRTRPGSVPAGDDGEHAIRRIGSIAPPRGPGLAGPCHFSSAIINCAEDAGHARFDGDCRGSVVGPNAWTPVHAEVVTIHLALE